MPSATSPSFTSARPSTATREHLEGNDVELLPELARLDRELLCFLQITVDGGYVSEQRIEPAVLGAGVQPVEDAGRALEPAVRDRALAAEDQVVVADPEREHRRAPQVTFPAAEAERTLSCLEAGRHVLDPPGGPAQPLEGVDRLARLELLLEDRPRLRPRAAGEGSVALLDTLLPGGDLGYVLNSNPRTNRAPARLTQSRDPMQPDLQQSPRQSPA